MFASHLAVRGLVLHFTKWYQPYIHPAWGRQGNGKASSSYWTFAQSRRPVRSTSLSGSCAFFFRLWCCCSPRPLSYLPLCSNACEYADGFAAVLVR